MTTTVDTISSTSNRDMDWFVDNVTMTIGLIETSSGVFEGNVSYVIESVMQGCSVKVTERSTNRVIEFEETHQDGIVMIGMSRFQPLLNTNGYYMLSDFRVKRYITNIFSFSTSDTIGNWDLDSGAITKYSHNAPTATDPADTWMVGCSWNLVLELDAQGMSKYGKLSDLISYVRHGHRVKIMFNKRAQEPDVVVINTVQDVLMTARSTTLVYEPHSTHMERLVTLTSSIGGGLDITVDYNSGQILTSTNITSNIKYYVDTRTWTTADQSTNTTALFSQGFTMRTRMESRDSMYVFTPDIVTSQHTDGLVAVFGGMPSVDTTNGVSLYMPFALDVLTINDTDVVWGHFEMKNSSSSISPQILNMNVTWFF